MAISSSMTKGRPQRSLAARCAALLALALLASWPTATLLWHYWLDHPMWGAHGFLVALLSAWMVFAALARDPQRQTTGSFAALAGLIALCVASALCSHEAWVTGQLLLLPPLLLCCVAAAFGATMARALAIPIGFLYFGMPVWEVLGPPLQQLTLGVARWCVPLLGLPGAFSGSTLHMPGGISFEVTLWCSGLGFLVQGLAVATLLGELEQAPPARRLGLLAWMVPLALLANWLRVLALMYIGWSTQMRHVLVTRYHLSFGYVLFGCVLVGFVMLAARRAPQPVRAVDPGARGRDTAALFWPTVAALALMPLLSVLLQRFDPWP